MNSEKVSLKIKALLDERLGQRSRYSVAKEICDGYSPWYYELEKSQYFVQNYLKMPSKYLPGQRDRTHQRRIRALGGLFEPIKRLYLVLGFDNESEIVNLTREVIPSFKLVDKKII